MSDFLKSEKVYVDRKVFYMDLKENDRGRVIKITEDVNGRRDTIMLPMAGLRDFLDTLDEFLDYEEDEDDGEEPEED